MLKPLKSAKTWGWGWVGGGEGGRPNDRRLLDHLSPEGRVGENHILELVGGGFVININNINSTGFQTIYSFEKKKRFVRSQDHFSRLK